MRGTQREVVVKTMVSVTFVVCAAGLISEWRAQERARISETALAQQLDAVVARIGSRASPQSEPITCVRNDDDRLTRMEAQLVQLVSLRRGSSDDQTATGQTLAADDVKPTQANSDAVAAAEAVLDEALASGGLWTTSHLERVARSANDMLPQQHATFVRKIAQAINGRQLRLDPAVHRPF